MNRYIVNVIFSQIIMCSLFATTLPAQNNLDAQEHILDLKIKNLEATTAKMKKIFSDPNLKEAYYDHLIKELETLKVLMNPKSTRTEEQLAALTDFEQRIVARASQYGINIQGKAASSPIRPQASIQAPAVQLPSVTPNIVQHNPLPPTSANQSEMFMQQGMINQMPSQSGAPYPSIMNDPQNYGSGNNGDPQNYYHYSQNPSMQTDWDQQQYPNMIQGNNEVSQGYNSMNQGNQYQNLLNAPTDMVLYSNNAPVTSQQPQKPNNYWSPSDEPNPQLLTSPRTSRNKSTTDSEPDSNTVSPSILKSMSGRFGNGNSVNSLTDLKQNARGTNSSDITLNDLKKRDR